MSELRERVYNFIKIQGPVTPTQVAKYIENESYVASAVLSELMASKRIRISSHSVGSSKLYYLDWQEDQIGDLIYPHLKSKEKEAYSLLKEHKVLKDNELETWCMLALRNLKDFASGILVETSAGSEGFWKFHLVSDKEASEIISDKWIHRTESGKDEVTESVHEFETKDPIVEDAVIGPANKEDLAVYVEAKKPEGSFYKKVMIFFDKNKIEIADESIIKKNKEFTFIVSLPSNIGKIPFFVYAKDKNSITENDVALAFVESQRINMVCMLISAGTVSRKTREILNKKYSGSVIFRKI